MWNSPASDTTYLYLVRHGATPPNEQRPYILQGSSINVGLSINGQRQAREAAEFFKAFPINHVYCSTLIRARETAEAIAGPHNLDVRSVGGLVECSVGRWEGMDWDSIRQRDEEAYRLFHDDPSVHPYLGGESYADVLKRVRPHFQQLLDNHRGESIVVVAHNIVNRVYLADLLGIDLRRAKDLRQKNACVNFVASDGQSTHVVTMNSVFHLSESPV